VANALVYIHSKDIIHRDIKLENIFYIWQNTLQPLSNSQAPSTNEFGLVAKIGDFGLSVRKEFQQSMRSVGSEGVKHVVGTPSYLPPEGLASSKVSFGTDVWAYGVVMWVLIMQEQPYTSTGITSIPHLLRFLEDGHRLEFDMSRLAGLQRPSEYVELAQLCWSSQPSQRPSMQQVVTAIAALEAQIIA